MKLNLLKKNKVSACPQAPCRHQGGKKKMNASGWAGTGCNSRLTLLLRCVESINHEDGEAFQKLKQLENKDAPFKNHSDGALACESFCVPALKTENVRPMWSQLMLVGGRQEERPSVANWCSIPGIQWPSRDHGEGPSQPRKPKPATGCLSFIPARVASVEDRPCLNNPAISSHGLKVPVS